MLSPKSGEPKEVKRKIQYHIQQLEIKIQNSKKYWNNYELDFDKTFVLTFIERHYNEIIHHLAEIKHHLQEINYRKQELPLVKDHFVPKHLVPIKRISQDKEKLKHLRSSRCASSKYVHQWEKMIGEVEIKPKISTAMVKGRVKLFENNKTHKRSSSTIDAFLDFCLEKEPSDTIHSVIEEINETPKNKISDFETKIGDNLQIYDVNDLQIKLPEDAFESCSDICPINDDKHQIDDCIKIDSEDVFESCTDLQEIEDRKKQKCEDNTKNELHKSNVTETNLELLDDIEDKRKQKCEDKTKKELHKSRITETNLELLDDMEDKKKQKCADKTQAEFPQKDVIQEKSIVTESKLELLDDVNALIEDDHLKIIKKDKHPPKIVSRSAQKEQEKEASDSGEAKRSVNVSTKPRVVKLHKKKNVAPNVLF